MKLNCLRLIEQTAKSFIGLIFSTLFFDTILDPALLFLPQFTYVCFYMNSSVHCGRMLMIPCLRCFPPASGGHPGQFHTLASSVYKSCNADEFWVSRASHHSLSWAAISSAIKRNQQRGWRSLEIVRRRSQIRLQLSEAGPTKRPQPKVIKQ